MAAGFDDFLSSIKYLDKQDILDTAYKKHQSLGKPSFGLTTRERAEFQQEVSDLLYLLETGQRSPDVSDRNFAKFKFICGNLVKKRQMDKSSLLLFE